MHQESVPRAARQHPAERSQQHSVVRLESRLPSLPAEDRQLVAEHENLQFLRSVAASDEHDQLQQPADDDVQGWRKHRRPPADGRDARRYRRINSPAPHPIRFSHPTRGAGAGRRRSGGRGDGARGARKNEDVGLNDSMVAVAPIDRLVDHANVWGSCWRGVGRRHDALPKQRQLEFPARALSSGDYLSNDQQARPSERRGGCLSPSSDTVKRVRQRQR
jgi:hypothetical protein